MSSIARYAPVTVIVPCYRCAATLRRAVETVAAQSEVPAEVILVEDCSGDDTREVIQNLVNVYAPNWIRTILLKQNMGAASARNIGWEAASQPFVAFLDADDAWHPEKIRLQLQYMQSHPEVALCGHAHKILGNGLLPDWRLHDTGAPIKYRRISKFAMLLSNRFITPSVMVRRDIPQRFVGRQRYMEDHMLWLNIVCSGALVTKLRVPLAAIYKRPYGHSGLSAQWWLMERGDLGNYRRLLAQNYINRIQFLFFTLYSGAKFLRRFMLHLMLSSGEK
jgi:glycosyltransferase involved in cell wall biosynthesis